MLKIKLIQLYDKEKNYLRTIGQVMGVWLVDRTGVIIINRLGCWLHDISYRGSKEEMSAAVNLEFDDNWNWYNKWQMQIIRALGLNNKLLNGE
ncbi:MAG: hypothetical protein KF721_09870 [Ignavibacteriaceae bacterium]|nr:hypothetical protein [Ignavibacteriaceae bacterium]